MTKKNSIFLEIFKKIFILLLISSLTYYYISNENLEIIFGEIIKGNYDSAYFINLILKGMLDNYIYLIFITILDFLIYIILIYTLFKRSVSIYSVEVKNNGEYKIENGIVKSIFIIVIIKIIEKIIYMFIPIKLISILINVAITYVIIKTYIKTKKIYKQVILFYKWFFSRKILKFLAFIISVFMSITFMISALIFSMIYLKENGTLNDYKIVLKVILFITFYLYGIMTVYIKYLYMWYLSEYINEYLEYLKYKIKKSNEGENN